MSTGPRYNAIAYWSMLFWLAVGIGVGIRFSLAETFDAAGFVDVIASVLNLVGFIAATYFILTPSALKTFIADFAPNALGWAFVTAPFGLFIASQPFAFAGFHSALPLANVSAILLSINGPIGLLLSRGRKDESADSKMGWFAGTLVLTGTALQLGTAFFRFAY